MALPSLAAIRAAVSALETAGITVLGLEEGEQRVTLLVKRDDEDAALCAVHDALVPQRGKAAVCAAKAAANRSFLCLPLLTDGEKNGFFIRRKESVAISTGICYPTLNRSALREQPISTGRMLRRLSTWTLLTRYCRKF